MSKFYFFSLVLWNKSLDLYRSDIVNGDGTTYMERWICKLPTGHMIRLHHIMRSDLDRHLHDHPFDFTSLLLTGGYLEFLPGLSFPMFRRRWSLLRRPATTLHKLHLPFGPVWTLVFTSPWKRQWGYQTEEGWVQWDKYRYADGINIAASSSQR